MTGPADPVALLAREARSLVERLRLWTPARFAAAAPAAPAPAAPRDGPATRGDVVHHLAASLAALSGAPVPLPRLRGPADDLALPDQLAVTADDLVRSAPPDDVARSATAHVLLHRADLLGDEVPAGLLAALGLHDAAGLRALAACPWTPTAPAGAGAVGSAGTTAGAR